MAREYKKGRITYQGTKLEKAWQSYNRQYQEQLDKGYLMDDKIESIEAFEQYYESAKLAGIKNIPRQLAMADRTFTRFDLDNGIAYIQEVTGEKLKVMDFMKGTQRAKEILEQLGTPGKSLRYNFFSVMAETGVLQEYLDSTYGVGRYVV